MASTYIDIFAFEIELAALKAEAESLGVRHAVLHLFDEMRQKALPAIESARERRGGMTQ